MALSVARLEDARGHAVGHENIPKIRNHVRQRIVRVGERAVRHGMHRILPRRRGGKHRHADRVVASTECHQCLHRRRQATHRARIGELRDDPGRADVDRARWRIRQQRGAELVFDIFRHNAGCVSTHQCVIRTEHRAVNGIVSDQCQRTSVLVFDSDQTDPAIDRAVG